MNGNPAANDEVAANGYRFIGDCRASIYNAGTPRQGVVDLVELMKEFEQANS